MTPSRASLALLLATLAGCASMPFDQTVTRTPPVTTIAPRGEPGTAAGPSDYLIGIGDELEIKFPDQTDLNEVVRVRPDGQIALRLVNAVQADGRTPAEVEADVAAKYRALAAPPGEGGDAKSARRYVLGVGDELELKFPLHDSYNQSVRIRPDGKISLNLVRTVEAEGKTPEELEAELNERYSAFLRRPNLVVVLKTFSQDRVFVGKTPVRPWLANVRPVVMVRTFAPRQVFVGGEVARPGLLPYREKMTLVAAILESGGHKPTGQIGTVLVLRRTGVRAAVAIRRDLRDDYQGTGNNDIYLEPSDIVLVPKTPIAEVAELMQQIFSMVPPLANSSVGFAYQLNAVQFQPTRP
ncbi:MAG TPA: polysaccharide biosynthesis/export family protein [Casimicrobiaceae bacterium]|nr:polysaccharide biosynthesis/export family protein [Casimicrobiaceae bacterium]